MKKLVSLLLVLLLVVALSACGEAANPVSKPGEGSSVPSVGAQGATTTVPVLPSGALTEADVKQKVLAHTGVAESVISRYAVEYDVDDGVPHYEVEFYVGAAEYEYDVHAVSGEILKAEKDDKSLLSSSSKVLISAEKAKSAVLSHAKLAENAVNRLKVELDKDDAVPHYEVEFDAGGYEYDYEIHAETGAVLKSEKERAD